MVSLPSLGAMALPCRRSGDMEVDEEDAEERPMGDSSLMDGVLAKGLKKRAMVMNTATKDRTAKRRAIVATSVLRELAHEEERFGQHQHMMVGWVVGTNKDCNE